MSKNGQGLGHSKTAAKKINHEPSDEKIELNYL